MYVFNYITIIVRVDKIGQKTLLTKFKREITQKLM